ncbi:MAG: Rieske 2Fe-2S domain-containing protein [Hydrogenophaga sp.]|uniref:Rieske 2Fe-2S domain-containing protein n=1 Tax=Hydrogenophaga sp. TaxID=1904254 RepID=UPI0025C003D3|nr:Rieske 2Fe-2S domain-containing protein [Hydrogenophaga sp.]MBU7573347.1 Rieske 2Fe-2S domain-containing protein [Hydrogenophaga sp.]
MLNQQDNDLLTRVENQAPLGQLMRRYWMPACMSEELPQPDGDPIKVRVLGENLVAFRATDGSVGVMDELCPHRRASLLYGRNEEGGLRCLYHGWKMDVEGNVVDTPAEVRREGAPCKKIRHKAYPVRESHGFVWIYMGEEATMPEFEPPAFANGTNPIISIAKINLPCNWAQIVEGGIDSAHASLLHSSEIRPTGNTARAGLAETHTLTRPSVDKAPRLHVHRTEYGMRYVALRTPITNPETDEYARIATFIAPCTVLSPPNGTYSTIQFIVPRDDESTSFYFVGWTDDQTEGTGVTQEVWRQRMGAVVGVDLDDDHWPLRTPANRFKQDRAAMKQGSFTGVRGIANQDSMMWVTMGPISDRSKERLGTSDAAVAQFRRVMVEAVKAFSRGEPPIGTTQPRLPHRRIRSFEGVIKKETDWRELGILPE